MESACPYLEGGTHSYQLATSHLVSLEEILVEFKVSLARGRDCGLTYLLRGIQVSLYHQNYTVYAAFLKTPL